MKSLRLLALRLWLPVLLVAGWAVASQGSQTPYFPPLQKIVAGFFATWNTSEMASTLWPSLLRLLAGFFLALAVGLVLGVAIGLSERARRCMSPFTEFFRAMPIAAIVPVGLILFGPGAAMEIALIAFSSCWPILVATTDAVRSVDPVMIETARVYGLSPRQRLVQIVLPAALPYIAGGVRMAIALAIASMLIANMFGSTGGLGYFIILAQQSFDIVATWAGLIMIGIVGVVLTGIFVLFERRALAWHRGWRGAEDAR
jgi:ABC-type nitrate/sulfonate/bicarbonate transport system permease component